MTNETKHTPGPWDVGNAHGAAKNHAVCAGPFVVARAVTSAGEHHVGGERMPWDHGTANARLIAAAPDLLSALKISLDEHYATWMAARAEVEGSRMSKQLFDMEPGVIAARAAIKRATEG